VIGLVSRPSRPLRPVRAVAALLALLLCNVAGVADTLARSDPSLRWRTLHSKHFALHYYQGEEPLAREFLGLAEEAHDRLARDFGFELATEGQLVLVDDADSANGLTTVAPYNFIIFYAYVPDPGADLGCWTDWKRILVYHEMAHLFHLDRVTGLYRWLNYVLGKRFLPNSMVPNWFVEGMAVLVESGIDAGGRIRSPLFEMYLRTAVGETRLLDLDEATGAPLALPRGTTAYLYGAYFVQWLADRFGRDALNRFIEEQGRKLVPLTINISARRIFGDTFVHLYEQWRDEPPERLRAQAEAVKQAGVLEGRRITFAGEHLPMPAFAPDGTLYWAHADGHDTPRLGRVATDGSESRVGNCIGGCDRPEVAADGNLYFSSSEFHDTFYYYQDLFRYDPVRNREDRLTHGARVKDPAMSPDGKSVAFVRNANGMSSLRIAVLEPWEERLVAMADGGFSWPAWSPDGTSLVVVRQDASGVALLLFDLSSGEESVLPAGPGHTIQPAFSPDGRLVFTSARTGIFNLEVLDPDSGTVCPITNVVGGAFSPAVSPDGKRVVYASYHFDGYHLFEVELPARGECRVTGQARSRHAAGAPPGGARGRHAAGAPHPPIGHDNATGEPRPDPTAGSQPETGLRTSDAAPVTGQASTPYNPLPLLRPYQWEPEFAATTWNQLAFAMTTGGADPAGLASWSLAGRYDMATDDAAVALAASANLFYPSLSAYGAWSDSAVWARIGDEFKDYRQTDWYASASLGFPILRTRYSFLASLSYAFDRFSGAIVGPWEHDPGGPVPYIPRTGQLGSLAAGLSFDDTESFGYSVVTEKGWRLSSEVKVSTPFLGSNWTEYQVSWRATRYTPMPWLDHHVLMLHLRGGIAGGRDEYLRRFSVGGYPDQDIIADMMANTGVGGTYLRGYPPTALRGRQYYFGTADYYFPVWRIRRGFQTFPIFLKDLYVDVFGNGAVAFDSFDPAAILWGAGGELRLTTTLSYYVDFTFILGGAYGFQDPGGFGMYFLVGK